MVALLSWRLIDDTAGNQPRAMTQALIQRLNVDLVCVSVIVSILTAAPARQCRQG